MIGSAYGSAYSNPFGSPTLPSYGQAMGPSFSQMGNYGLPSQQFQFPGLSPQQFSVQAQQLAPGTPSPFASASPMPGLPTPYTGQDKLQAYLDAIGKQGQQTPYDPPSPYMFPKVPGWLAILAGLASAFDKSGQVGPAIASGFANGGQMASQNEAIRREEAIKAAQQAQQAEVQRAGVDYNATRDQVQQRSADESQARQFQQQKELEGLRQTGKRSSAAIQQDLKVAPDPKADGNDRADAAERLTAEGIAAYTPEYIAWLRTQQGTTRMGAEAGAKQKESAANLLDTRASDITATQASRIDAATARAKTSLASGKASDARAALDTARADIESIHKKYADQEFKAKLDKIKAETTRAIESAKAMKSGKAGADGKPITDTAFLNNWRQLQTDQIGAQGKAREAQANVAYWTVQLAKIKNGTYKVAPEGQEDEAAAQARGLQEAQKSIDYYRLQKQVSDQSVADYKAAGDTAGGMRDASQAKAGKGSNPSGQPSASSASGKMIKGADGVWRPAK